MHLTERFYTAFQQRDWATVGTCYHTEARFSDPVFPDLDAEGVKVMWKMLLTSGTDLRVTFTVVEEKEGSGVVEWEAFYTFSKTKRPVHNRVRSVFVIKDGLILGQVDSFDFWRWSRQALGISGVLLGWTPLVRNKVRAIAANGLRKAIDGSLA